MAVDRIGLRKPLTEAHARALFAALRGPLHARPRCFVERNTLDTFGASLVDSLVRRQLMVMHRTQHYEGAHLTPEGRSRALALLEILARIAPGALEERRAA